MTAPVSSVFSSTPDVASLLRALRFRWRLALVLSLLCSASVAAVALQVIPHASYTAKSILHIHTFRPKIIFDTSENKATFSTYQKTQVALIKSRRVLNAALKRPEVADSPTLREHADRVEWLEDSIKVDFPGGSELLQISLSGKHPADLAALVNSVTDAYLETIEGLERKERLERLDALRSLYKGYQGDLEAKRKTIRELASTVGSNDKQTLALQQQFTMQQLAESKNDLMRLRSELRSAQLDLTVLEARAAAREASPMIASEVEAALANDARVREYRTRLAELQQRIHAVERLTRQGNDPGLSKLSRDFVATRANLATLQAALRQSLTEKSRRETRARDEEDVAEVKSRIAALDEHDRNLRREIVDLAKEAESFNKGTLDLQSHQDEVVLVSETAKKVGTELEAMEVELGAKPRITELDRAEVPRKKDEMRRIKASAGAGAATFAAVLLGVSFWEFRARRITTPDEVTKGLGLRLVGCLPDQRRRPPARRAEQNRRWHSYLVDSIDAIRTMLLHISRAESVKVVMVTSAVKGEGKSSLSVHLATSLARAGRRTLLIDCDLRSPAVHRLFNMPQGPGLSEVLRGEMRLADAIRPTSAADLSVLTTGRVAPEVVQSLAVDDSRAIFEALRREFDFVIVDSAPVLPLVDSLVIGQHVDGVIFSLLREVSQLPKVQAAYERLATLGIHIIGAVINGTAGDFDDDYHRVPMPAELSDPRTEEQS